MPTHRQQLLFVLVVGAFIGFGTHSGLCLFTSHGDRNCDDEVNDED